MWIEELDRVVEFEMVAGLVVRLSRPRNVDDLLEAGAEPLTDLHIR